METNCKLNFYEEQYDALREQNEMTGYNPFRKSKWDRILDFCKKIKDNLTPDVTRIIVPANNRYSYILDPNMFNYFSTRDYDTYNIIFSRFKIDTVVVAGNVMKLHGSRYDDWEDIYDSEEANKELFRKLIKENVREDQIIQITDPNNEIYFAGTAGAFEEMVDTYGGTIEEFIRNHTIANYRCGIEGVFYISTKVMEN